MKKKIRRFDVGGDVRSRAYAWLEEQKLKEAYGDEGKSAPEPKPAPRDAAAPKSAAAPKPTASSSSPAPAPSTRVSMGSQNEATYTPRGKFTDSDAESRAARQSEADDENVRRIQRARDEADNSERISRAGVSMGSQNDAEDKPSANRSPGLNWPTNQYSPERRAARLQRSAENADRGGMSPQAEKAVDAAMTVASVVPAARIGLGAIRAGREVATAAAQQARTRAGLGRQFAEGAEDASRATAGAPRTTVRDVAAGAREVAARRIEAAKSPAQRARERAEELRRTRGEGMEPMDTGITMPPTVRERAAEAARSAVESGRRLYNKMKPEPKLVRGRGRNFAESADDAAQKGYKKGGKVSASSRADGIAQRGKTRGRYL